MNVVLFLPLVFSTPPDGTEARARAALILTAESPYDMMVAEARARAALALAQAQTKPPTQPTQKELWGDYTYAKEKAERNNNYLIVFIGCRPGPSQVIGDADYVSVESLDGFTAPCVVPCRAIGGHLMCANEAPLGPDCTIDQIRATLRRILPRNQTTTPQQSFQQSFQQFQQFQDNCPT